MKQLIFLFTLLFLISCNSRPIYYENQKAITSACALDSHINDTVIIEGTYYQCMEYSGFRALKKDSCQQHYDMELNFDKIEIPEDLLNKIYSIEGCTGTIRMTVKGILNNESKSGYGHLGTNNAELVVQKVFEFGKVKYLIR